MSSLTLVRRGTISATSSDGAGPKDSSAFAAVKTGSSFVVARIRDRRQDVSVQRGTVTISSGGTSPNDVTITAVDLACSKVSITVRENRDGNARGVTAKLTSTTNLRLAFYGTVDSSEFIEVEWEVSEHKSRRGATVALQSTTAVRMAWDGTLQPGETIDCAFDVYDLDDVGDQLLESDYKLLRLLGFAGECSLQDLMTYDQAGNPATFRIRTFETKANLLLATPGLPALDALEAGELSRTTVTLTWSTGQNRPSKIQSVLEVSVAATPGVS